MAQLERAEVEESYRHIQDAFCSALEAIDGHSTFREDFWERPEGGGGATRILAGKGPIEKAAVNFSAVHGPTPPRLSEQLASRAGEFYATGVSIIVHPRNPHAPTFHANLRYFETDAGHAWFGGGADLTPYYLYEEDARHFHSVMKSVCDANEVADYAAWKQACDRYFYLPHRGEARGVGGLFFDHLTARLPEVWAFQKALGAALVEAYIPILRRRIEMPYGEAETRWHEIRRGRYAEFNLVWDRGTRFGLETGGRTESILASLPPRARWVYDHHPEPASPEARLLDMVRAPPRDWI
ncbi:MAG: oxygen-dependent coproporphyrinogen oxidase [Acidimicrobiia bacterium]